MIDDKTILAVIPARGGSKGIPKKNIKTFAGKPLIGWTIESALKSKYIDQIVVSTDDFEIAQVAENFNSPAPYIRKKEFATDEANGTLPVLEAIEKFPEYDVVILLQPTSPLRDTNDIDKAIEQFVKKNIVSLVSVTPNLKPIEWLYKMNEEGNLKNISEENISYRQLSSEIFVLNGAIYIIKTRDFLKHKKFILEQSYGFVMSPENSVDIDTMFDFDLAEYLMLKRL